jgi:hypothetical protein
MLANFQKSQPNFNAVTKAWNTFGWEKLFRCLRQPLPHLAMAPPPADDIIVELLAFREHGAVLCRPGCATKLVQLVHQT